MRKIGVLKPLTRIAALTRDASNAFSISHLFTGRLQPQTGVALNASPVTQPAP